MIDRPNEHLAQWTTFDVASLWSVWSDRSGRSGQILVDRGRSVRRTGRLLVLALLLTVVAGQAGATSAQSNDQGFPAELPGIGDPVSFPAEGAGMSGADSGEITVTVTQLVDPFGAFGSGSPPEGSRFVYLGLLIANGTDVPLVIDPARLFVVDASGFTYRPSDRFGAAILGQDDDDDATPADQANETVEPGGEITGGAVFAVPENATLAAVYHDPAPDRLILLAILGEADSAPDDEPEDGADGADGADGTDGQPGQDGQDGQDGVNGGNGGDGGDGGDAVAGSDGRDSGDGTSAAAITITVPDDVDCDVFTPYYDDLNERLNALNDAVGSINDLVGTVMSDPLGAGEAITTAASDAAALAEEQADADVPPGFEDLNDAAVAMFDAFAGALDNLATGMASFDMTAIEGVTAEIEAAGAQNEEVVGVVNAVAEGCGLEV